MLIQQTNWLTRARKAAGGKGPAQAELLDDLSQQITVVDLSQPEYDFLGGVKRMVAPFDVPAVAAQSSFISLFNPLGSFLVVVIDRWGSYSPTANIEVAEAFLVADTAGAILSPVPADFRWNPQNPFTSATVVRVGQAAAPGGVANIANNKLTASESIEFPRCWVLAPGTGVIIKTVTLNVRFVGEVWYHERPAESGELPAGT